METQHLDHSRRLYPSMFLHLRLEIPNPGGGQEITTFTTGAKDPHLHWHSPQTSHVPIAGPFHRVGLPHMPPQ